MPYDTFALFVASYGSKDDAEADYDAVKALYYEDGLMDTFDAVVLGKTTGGKVEIAKKHEQPTRHGAWLGGGVGLAAGVVVCLFPGAAIPLALASGTAVGAGLGAVAGHLLGGLSRGDLKDLGEQLDAGQYALVVVAAVDLEKRVDELIARAQKLERKQLRADQKELRRELDDLRDQLKA